MQYGKVPQQAAAVFPKLEVGGLHEVLHQRPRGLTPQRSRSHNGEADGLSHSQNELLPGHVITRPGTKTYDVFQRKRRVPRRSGDTRHIVEDFSGSSESCAANSHFEDGRYGIG
jgi:hypothetical protein